MAEERAFWVLWVRTCERETGVCTSAREPFECQSFRKPCPVRGPSLIQQTSMKLLYEPSSGMQPFRQLVRALGRGLF